MNSLTLSDGGGKMVHPIGEDSKTQLHIPAHFESTEQKIAYQEFINVLSAILVKYAASLEKDTEN